MGSAYVMTGGNACDGLALGPRENKDGPKGQVATVRLRCPSMVDQALISRGFRDRYKEWVARDSTRHPLLLLSPSTPSLAFHLDVGLYFDRSGMMLALALDKGLAPCPAIDVSATDDKPR